MQVTPNAGWAYETHNMESWRMTMEVTVPSVINGTSFGIGLGIDSINGYNDYENIVRWSFDTDGIYGRRPVLYDTSTFSRQVTPSPEEAYIYTPSTKYWLETERIADTYYHKLYADSAKTTLLKEWTSQPTGGYANTAWLWANTGKFAIWSFGATFTLHSLRIERVNKLYAAKNAFITFVGDSHTVGFKNSLSNRYINRLIDGGYFAANQCAVMAGIGDRTDEAQLNRSAIQALNNSRILVCLGANDKISGDANATINNNWDNLIDGLISDNPNAEIIIMTPPASTNFNMNVIAAHQVSEATSRGLQYFDAYTATKGAGTAMNAAYNSGDNLHLNAAGHSVLFDGVKVLL